MHADRARAAVAQCERYGLELTMDNLVANVELKPGDYNALIASALRQQLGAALKRAGFIIADENSYTRISLEDARLSDLKAQLSITGKHLARVRVKYEALKALVEFLEAKKAELGYDPYVHLFEEDARRIYSMHGLELPRDWGRAIG